MESGRHSVIRSDHEPPGAGVGARRVALEALVRLERGRLGPDEALQKGFESFRLAPVDRRLATELVYGVLRHRARIDWVLEGFCRQPLRRLSPTIRNILRVGAYQLLDLDRIPARAAVDEAVRLTRQKGAKGMSGVVNAVLRALDRDRSEPVFPDPEKDLVGHLSIRYSHPDWMVRRWLQRYGADNTRRLCEANNQIPPITLRANTLRVDRDRLEREIGPLVEKIEPCRVSALGLKTAGGQLIGTEPYRKGWFYIQDEAAQLVVQALDPRPGETVLDACAAPGGKSTQMAAAMENRGRVIANDPDAARLGLVRENCRRLGAGIVECRSEDMINPGGLRGERIDKILLDVPCSGLGILRRNPDGKWRKRESLIMERAAMQRRMLDEAAALLKPGGAMVYSTCTIEPEENEQVIRTFLDRHPEFSLDDPGRAMPPAAHPYLTQEGFFLTVFNQESMDGFFAARMIKETV